MTNILDNLTNTESYTWVFSGIGVFVLGLIISFGIYLFQKLEGKNIYKLIIFILVITILILAILVAFFYRHSVIDSNHTTKITNSFKTLFENKWSLNPYSDDEALPCYLYQGKWEHDTPRYHMVINDGDGFIYYISKSVILYTWCQVDNPDGRALEGLELLTNQVYFSEKKTDPYSLSEDKLIGEISALFFDKIQFGESSNNWIPVRREGKRIGRYSYVLYSKNNSSAFIMDRTIKFIEKLVKPICSLNTSHIFPGYNLIKGKSVIEFDCKYYANGEKSRDPQKYKKRVVFKGKREVN